MDPDPQPVAQPVDPDPWFVDYGQVQSLTGAAAPDFTVQEGRDALDRLVQSADSLLISDGLARDPDGEFFRSDTVCSSDASCTTTDPDGFSSTNSLSDLLYNDLDVESLRAVATYRGVSLGKVRTSDTYSFSGEEIPVDIFNYGGWLEHSFFVVQFEEVTERGDYQGTKLAGGVSIGDATDTNPDAGSGTWSGVMVGIDGSGTATQDHVIQGDADITIADFSNPQVDVAFTNVYDLDAGTQRNDMTWSGIDLASGEFETGQDGNSIEGRFYGPNHEEVGGVFERNRIIGAFGASRQ